MGSPADVVTLAAIATGAAVAAVVVAIHVLRPGARTASSAPAAVMLLAGAWWAACSAVQWSSTEPRLVRAAWVAHLPGSGLVVYGIAWFAMLFVGRPWGRRLAAVLLIEPVAVGLLGLVGAWRGILIAPDGTHEVVGYWVHALYNHALLIIVLAVLVAALSQAVRDRWSLVVAIGAVALPMMTQISALIQLGDRDEDITPIVFVAAAAVWIWVERGGFGMRAGRPLTIDQVVEAIGDGVFVVDEHGRVLAANSAARSIARANGVRGDLVGLAWDQLVPARDLTAARYGGLLLVGTRAFDVRVTPIGEPPLGWVSVLRDVTEAESVRQVLAAQASSDELTGLGNRRTLLDAGRRLIEESHAAGRPLAAAMVDIDHFKRVNDTHGHQVGDRVIARVAAQVQRRARLGDVQVRFGGEEFLLLMADETVPGAVERMEELRAACAQLRIPARDADAAITVSIGVCGLLPGGDIESLLHAADRALYRAKQEGRDRVRAD